MPNPADESVRKQALELRRCGWSCVQVAAALDVSPQAVGRWSKAAQIGVRGVDRRVRAVHIMATVNERNAAPVTHYSAELAAAWPMPVALPVGTARIVPGVLHTDTDGSGPRHG